MFLTLIKKNIAKIMEIKYITPKSIEKKPRYIKSEYRKEREKEDKKHLYLFILLVIITLLVFSLNQDIQLL